MPSGCSSSSAQTFAITPIFTCGEKFRGWLLAGTVAQFLAAGACFGMSAYFSIRLTMIFGVMPLLGLAGLIVFLKTLPER